jgi:hypothetical protein
MPIEIKGIKDVKAGLARLRAAAKVPEVVIDGLPATEEQKIEWLVRGRPGVQSPRDFLRITPKLMTAMVTAFTRGLAKVATGASPDTPWKMAGEVYLAQIVKRVQFSGGDLHNQLAPLKESTVRAKGGNTRLFYHTGDLLKALMSARIRVIR